MGVKLKHANFQPSSASETFFKIGVEWPEVRNLMENWPYLGNGER